jgi:hypothetical protein
VATGVIALGLTAASAVGAPVNLRGTITRVSGDTLEIHERNGAATEVHLTKDAKVATVVKASMSEVKPGSYVGTAAVPGPKGTLRALELHIFPPSMRGVGEGSRAWNLTPQSSMTNGTVAQKVARVSGDKVVVDYRGGHKTVSITPTTKVVALVPGNRSDLKAKAKIFIPGAIRNPNGSLEASRVTVGRNGVAPPM